MAEKRGPGLPVRQVPGLIFTMTDSTAALPLLPRGGRLRAGTVQRWRTETALCAQKHAPPGRCSGPPRRCSTDGLTWCQAGYRRDLTLPPPALRKGESPGTAQLGCIELAGRLPASACCLGGGLCGRTHLEVMLAAVGRDVDLQGRGDVVPGGHKVLRLLHHDPFALNEDLLAGRDDAVDL